MGQFAWIVKFALRMLTFMTHFGENKLWQQQNCFCHLLASIFPYSFLVGPYAFLVGPCVFFRPYHFDAYGPHTGPFLLWFSKEIARGAVRVI